MRGVDGADGADGAEFRNRFGDPLVMGETSGVALPQPVLRLLREAGEEPGGRPPRGRKEIPEDMSGDWFKAHMHLFEAGRDGVWRPKTAAR